MKKEHEYLVSNRQAVKESLTIVQNYETWKLNDDIQFPNNFIWEPRRVEIKKEILNVILDENDNRCIRIQGLPTE